MTKIKLILLFILLQVFIYLSKFNIAFVYNTFGCNIIILLTGIWFLVELIKFYKTPISEVEPYDPKNKYLVLLPIFVFSTYNIIHIYSLNILIIHFLKPMIALVCILVINFSIYFILLYFIKRNITASIITCFWIILTNFYIPISTILSSYSYFLLFSLFAIILIHHNNLKLFKILFVLSSILLCFSVYDLGTGFIKKVNLKATKKHKTIYYNHIQKNKTNPNVYIILLDAYPGNSTLKEELDFDNKDFVQNLQDRKFFVYNEMYANYTKTAQSLPSFLNFDYIENLNTLSPSEAIINSKLFYNAKSNNYHTTFINAAAPFIRLNENGNIDTVIDLTNSYSKNYYLFSKLFFNRTIYYNFFRNKEKFKIKEKDIVLELLSEYSKYNKKNEFVFTHILKPHYPYTKDANGNDIYEEDFLNNDIYTINKMACVNYIKYINKKTIELIDQLLKNSGPNTYIIIFGDHGLRLMYSGTKDETILQNKKVIKASFNTFTAIYSPNNNYNYYKQATSLLDIYKLFSNDLFKTNYPLEKNKFYYTFYRQSYDTLDMPKENYLEVPKEELNVY